MTVLRCPVCHVKMAEETQAGVAVQHRGRKIVFAVGAKIIRYRCDKCKQEFVAGETMVLEKEQV